MKSAQVLKGMGKADVVELDNLFRRALGTVFQRVVALIDGLRECQSNECIDLINTEFNDLMTDARYLMSRIKEGRGYDLSLVVNFVRAMYDAFQYLAGFGLLNTDYREFVDDALTNSDKVQALLFNMGRVLTHAACMARYRGLTRVGGYVVDKTLLLLGMAMDDALHGNSEKFMYLFASAFLALYGKEDEASSVLARAGYEYNGLDRFLDFCSSLAKLYELGVRFTDNDYS